MQYASLTQETSVSGRRIPAAELITWVVHWPSSQRKATGRRLPPTVAAPTAIQTSPLGQETPPSFTAVAPAGVATACSLHSAPFHRLICGLLETPPMAMHAFAA
jgi:hypothetical protein